MHQITKRKDDYSQWYQDVIKVAELAEHSPVKGCMVIKPNGYAIWESIQQVLDSKFKSFGIQNAYFPLLIPESYLKKEQEHVEGFAPEVAVVNYAGGAKLNESFVIRPTSETIMYEVYSKWIKSYRDLPLLINQWANVMRWELRTRLFLRTSEFLWQEGHTVHESQKEANNWAKKMLEVYKDFSEKYLAIPVVAGVKTDMEKFAGAKYTYTLEAMMQDGKALQMGTSHDLSDNFSKAFEIKFLDKNNDEKYAFQTSFGVSTRLIGALIMAHSDDNGLVIPPMVAQKEVVFVVIYKNQKEREKILNTIDIIKTKLDENKIGYIVDDRDIRVGEKIYEWEKKGIPLRVEMGPKDIEKQVAILVRRDEFSKKEVALKNVYKEIIDTLALIQDNLYKKALKRMEENTVFVENWNEFKKAIKENKFVYAFWDGERKTEEKIKEETKASIRCIPFDKQGKKGKCVLTGKNTDKLVLFAKNY